MLPSLSRQNEISPERPVDEERLPPQAEHEKRAWAFPHRFPKDDMSFFATQSASFASAKGRSAVDIMKEGLEASQSRLSKRELCRARRGRVHDHRNCRRPVLVEATATDPLPFPGMEVQRAGSPQPVYTQESLFMAESERPPLDVDEAQALGNQCQLNPMIYQLPVHTYGVTTYEDPHQLQGHLEVPFEIGSPKRMSGTIGANDCSLFPVGSIVSAVSGPHCGHRGIVQGLHQDLVLVRLPLNGQCIQRWMNSQDLMAVRLEDVLQQVNATTGVLHRTQPGQHEAPEWPPPGGRRARIELYRQGAAENGDLLPFKPGSYLPGHNVFGYRSPSPGASFDSNCVSVLPNADDGNSPTWPNTISEKAMPSSDFDDAMSPLSEPQQGVKPARTQNSVADLNKKVGGPPTSARNYAYCIAWGDIGDLTVVQLREKLRERRLSSCGDKAKLLDRLKRSLENCSGVKRRFLADSHENCELLTRQTRRGVETSELSESLASSLTPSFKDEAISSPETRSTSNSIPQPPALPAFAMPLNLRSYDAYYVAKGDVGNWTVKQLRARLRSMGLSATGDKVTMVNRLKAAQRGRLGSEFQTGSNDWSG